MSIEVNELLGKPGDSDESSDSDQEIKPRVPHSSSVAVRKPRSASKKATLSLDATLLEINTLLVSGRPVNLADPRYPKLFVVNYRGSHYFGQFFTQQQRRKTRQRIKSNEFNDPIYAAALYDLAGLTMGEPVDTPLKKDKIIRAKKELDRELTALQQTRPDNAKPWWTARAETTIHENLLYRHYQRFVNSYETFREESQKREYQPYRMMGTAKNPYISTADEARHAILYALGGKAELSHSTLRPTYHAPGAHRLRAKHPKVGYVQIIFHSLDDLARYNPLFLSALHASNKVDIKDRNLNERETTFKSSIRSRHIVFTQQVRFPSFNVPFSSQYHPVKYGITEKSAFSRYSNIIFSGTGNTGLLEHLATHYAQQLQQRAVEIAEEKGGYIVYLGLDGRLQKALPTTEDVRKVRRMKTDVFGAFSYNLSRYKPESKANEYQRQ